LQQAVQGKLTERDPADEPASELLKRIRAEKVKLIAEGKIKKEKPLPPITDEEKPFDIPDTWEWVRLGDLVRYQGGYAYKSDTYVGCSNNQVIRLGNVKNNKLLLDAAPVFVPDHIACETEEYRITPNTILFTMTGTKGKRDYFYTCCTTENNMGSKKLYLNQRVGCLKSDSDIYLEWLVIFLQSEIVLSQIFATATGNVNQANIGSNSTLNLALPLPPLAEQKRIVARVEELRTVCDGLK
jgi:type I restriction enzyme S subunit